MSDRHLRITTDTLEHLAYLNTMRDDLTQWERDLIDDRLEAIRKFGDSAVLTPKQTDSIKKLYLVKFIQSVPDVPRAASTEAP